MPAGPIGSCWATGSWTDTCWEEFTWEDATGFTQATTLGDLTTLFVGEYIPELKAASPTALDVDTLVRDHLTTVQGTVTDDDLNTLYAIYISST